MRKSIFLAIALFVCLGAVAQQSSNNLSSSATSDGNTSSATDRDPLASPRPKDFWDGDDPNLVNLVTHPFANKKYVQRKSTPIRDRINELEQITSENSRLIRDVDTRAQQGIHLASEKSGLADQHASDAAMKAQGAQTASNEASARVSAAEQMVGNLDQYKESARAEIRFRPGETLLSKTAKDALDEMAGALKDERGYIIEVSGFAPGQDAVHSSQKMADAVVRYLVLTHNIPVYRIHEMNMGNAAAMEAGKGLSSARVDVSILKNDLATSAKQ